MLFTAVIVLLGLSLRDLNTIAPLITMFFMITYGMVNLVVLIEQSLSLPSYRPTIKIPIIIPIIGTLGSFTVMFIINALVALSSLVLIVVFYFYLVRKQIRSEAGDSRSGLFTALAEWATKKSNQLSPTREVRSWRPDLLIPITAPRDIRSAYKIIESIVYPKGSIKIISIPQGKEDEKKRLETFLPISLKRFTNANLVVSHTKIDGDNFYTAVHMCMQSLNAAFFKPNTLFICLTPETSDYKQLQETIDATNTYAYGMLLYVPFSSVGLALENSITLWLTNISPNWNVDYNIGDNQLSILTAIMISKNWNAKLMIRFINTPNRSERFTEKDYEAFCDAVRLPHNTSYVIIDKEFREAVMEPLVTDLNIFSITDAGKIESMRDLVYQSRISALFCSDSGYESALV